MCDPHMHAQENITAQHTPKLKYRDVAALCRSVIRVAQTGDSVSFHFPPVTSASGNTSGAQVILVEQPYCGVLYL